MWISYPSNGSPDSSENVPDSVPNLPETLVLVFCSVKTVSTGKSPIPRNLPPCSTPCGSESVFPSIWNPPQIPNTAPPESAKRRIFASSPLCRSHRRSAIVFFVPGRITRSGSPNCCVDDTYRTDTPSIASSARKSVKLLIRGSRMTAMSTSAAGLFSRRSERLSSSSMSRCTYGTTPTTGMPKSSSSCLTPGVRMDSSPRNLLMITPLTCARSSGFRSATVP